MQSPYALRRKKLMEQIGPEAVLLLPGAQLRHRNGDSTYRFRQDSDLFYLTGFAEPNALLLLAPGREKKVVLFVPPRDRERETWDGRRAGTAGAIAEFGADEAYSIDEIDEHLPGYLENANDLYHPIGRDAKWDARVVGWLNTVRSKVRAGVAAPRRYLDVREVVAELRLRKEPGEIALLHRAAGVTKTAHEAAMRGAVDGAWEYEIEALIEYEFRRGGGMGPGYTTIVGSGANATILHYIENNAQLRTGDLLLVDAGCEVDHYTADVTRTYPVGGKWRPEAKRIYEAVLDAQLAALAEVKPGATLDSIHARAVEVLVDHLIELKLLGESRFEAIEKGTYRRFYMHRTSHWLGIDVHDAGSYRVAGKPRPLEPGFVLTIEPGLYFAADDETVPEAYRGIGVRIEDDVLVTEKGSDVLTANIAKTPDDMAALLGASK